MYDFGDAISTTIATLSTTLGWITPTGFLGGAVLVGLGLRVGFGLLGKFVGTAKAVSGGGRRRRR